MQPQDFEEIEKVVIEKYLAGFNEEALKMLEPTATVAARIATLAIQEYHRKLQQASD